MDDEGWDGMAGKGRVEDVDVDGIVAALVLMMDVGV